MIKIHLGLLVNSIMRFFLGRSPNQLYVHLMIKRYKIDVNKDLPDESETIRIEEEVAERYKNFQWNQFERYVHEDFHYDGLDSSLYISISIFNRFWKERVFKNFEISEKMKHVLVAELPDPSFNAFCIKTGGGYLVIFNRGLSLFLARSTKLLLGCTRLVYLSETSEPTIGSKLASDSLKTEIELLMLKKYHFKPLPLDSKLHVLLYPILIYFLECWVCAHELGHCALSTAKASSIQAEFDADSLGYTLYKKIINPFYPDTQGDPLIGAFSFAAPHLFFCLSEACEKYKPHSNSHPPAAQRSEMLRAFDSKYSVEQKRIGNVLINQLIEMLAP